MAYAAELRDPYTAGHQKRVAALSREIAHEMHLSEMMVEEVEKAALVHDLGKFEIPTEILCKPGRISQLEMAIIRRHAEAGYEILIHARIIAVADVVEAMSSHRPYRAALGIEKGLDEVKSKSGMLYDPSVVTACCTLFRKRGFVFPEA